MVEIRKNAEAREKEFRLAIYRIQKGRAHSKETQLSIASVAREAGVSPALIHNHFLGLTGHTGATYFLENPRVARFSRSVVAIDDRQTDPVERQPLVGSQGVDMPDPMHLP